MKTGKVFGVVVWVGVALGCVAGCSKQPPPASTAEPTAADAAPPATAASAPADPIVRPDLEAPAGEIFGVPVSVGNYAFAAQVAAMYSAPWGAADVPEDQRQAHIWENLMLHYEGTRQGITVSDDEVEDLVNQFLSSAKQPFTRRGDSAAYERWVSQAAGESVGLFENQMRYLLQIRKFKEQIFETQQVEATDEEALQEFRNERNHVGGEMAVFNAKSDADAFYGTAQSPKQWEKMKAAGQQEIRPVALMTLEAYIDLWSIPKAQIEAFHAMELGVVGPPMPFGTTQWCVYRLLEKRVADPEEFPNVRDSYVKQVQMKKKFEARARWIESFKQSANLKIFLPTPAAS